MTLSLTTLALTIAEASAYVASRGLTGWPADDAAKTVALRRGQDYIAGLYNGRWTVEFDDADAPDAVKYAITEAAVREAVSPGVLSPDVTPGAQKVLVGVGSLRWERVKLPSGADAMRPHVSVIEGLLTGLVSSGSTQFLERA